MVNTIHRLEHERHGFDNFKMRFQCERQKCEDEELQALLDDDPIQISYRQQFESRIDRKTTGMGQETWKSDFVIRQFPVSHIKTGEIAPGVILL